jgi:hypothetical protein
VPRKQVSRRRRGRKTIEYDFAEAPDGEAAADEAALDDEEEAVEAAPGAQYVRSGAPAGRLERHVSRDYSHVRGEVIRIVVIAGGLIIAIIVGGFFR